MKGSEVMEFNRSYWLRTVTIYGFWHRELTVIQRIPLMLSRAKLLLPSNEEQRIVDLCYTLITMACNKQPD